MSPFWLAVIIVAATCLIAWLCTSDEAAKDFFDAIFGPWR